jgi:hypothetical protein
MSCNNNQKTNDEVIMPPEEEYYYKGKNIYITEEEYLNGYYDFNYFAYRSIMLNRCLDKNDFTYFESEILDTELNTNPLKRDHLVGNQLDDGYMELIKKVIHIKNNLSFGNKEIDDKYISGGYSYFDPTQPKTLSRTERKILLQINSYLYPKEEEMNKEELNGIILGIWQKDNPRIGDGYFETFRFSDTLMAIVERERNMVSRQDIPRVEGKYRITSNNIIMEPDNNDFIKGGIISYPIISLSKIYNEYEGKHYYKLVVFIDRPTTYYKIREKIEVWEK